MNIAKVTQENVLMAFLDRIRDKIEDANQHNSWLDDNLQLPEQLPQKFGYAVAAGPSQYDTETQETVCDVFEESSVLVSVFTSVTTDHVRHLEDVIAKSKISILKQKSKVLRAIIRASDEPNNFMRWMPTNENGDWMLTELPKIQAATAPTKLQSHPMIELTMTFKAKFNVEI